MRVELRTIGTVVKRANHCAISAVMEVGFIFNVGSQQIAWAVFPEGPTGSKSSTIPQAKR